jgi:hypothetical protein
MPGFARYVERVVAAVKVAIPGSFAEVEIPFRYPSPGALPYRQARVYECIGTFTRACGSCQFPAWRVEF